MKALDNSVSVCVVLFKRWEMSKKTLTSIANTIPSDWLIKWSLIDNGSQDETSSELNSFARSLRGEIEFLQVLKEPMPQTRAVNRTINAANGKYILRVDNDIDFKYGWFEDALATLSDDAFPNLGFVCPTHHLKDGNPNYKPMAMVNGSSKDVKIDMVSRLNMNVPGNIFGLTSVIKDIGGFYTPYNLLHADVHYCHVARHIGYEFGYLLNSHCPHIGNPDGKSEYSEKAVTERRSEEARYSSIAKGDVKGKHPQEVEFAQQTIKMMREKGKVLPRHKDVNILIPSCGRRVELVRAFKGVFDIPRWSGKVITCGMDRFMSASFESDDHIVTPPISDEGYVDSIMDICIKHKIKYIFPVIDYDIKVLSKAKNKILRKTGSEVVSLDHEKALLCFDKLKTSELFNSLGIPHPMTYEDAGKINLSGDYISKPQFGFASKNIQTLSFNNESYSCKEGEILQRKVEGREFTIDLVSDRRFDIVSLVSRERLVTRAGEIAVGKIVNHLHLFPHLATLSKKLEMVGPWNAQVIIDKNETPWFIEINSRFGGGNPMSLRAGQNQPLLSLKVLERDFFGYHNRYLVDWGLTALRFDDCNYGYIEESIGDQDGDGSKRLKG